MAENEKKDLEKVAEKAPKAKSDKPSVWKRIGNWFRGLRSEWKKISWTSWKTVKSSTLIVLVCIIIFAAAIAILDFVFGHAISGLNDLANMLGA